MQTSIKANEKVSVFSVGLCMGISIRIYTQKPKIARFCH